MNEHSGISRRKLLRTTAIGVPAAGLLAFGSTLVTATSANALEVDGYWGSETTVELQLMVTGVRRQQNFFKAPSWQGFLVSGGFLAILLGILRGLFLLSQYHVLRRTPVWLQAGSGFPMNR